MTMREINTKSPKEWIKVESFDGHKKVRVYVLDDNFSVDPENPDGSWWLCMLEDGSFVRVNPSDGHEPFISGLQSGISEE